MPSVYKPIYSLGPDWPSLELNGDDDDKDDDTLVALEVFLTKRIATRNTLEETYKTDVETLRASLVEQEKELIVLREENSRLKGGSDGERRRIKDLETRLVNAEAANNSLQRKNSALAEAKSVLERDLDDKELQINTNKKKQHESER